MDLIQRMDQMLSTLSHNDLERPIAIQHMPDSNSAEVFTTQSAVIRELAFVAHHCVHHQSMMRYCLLDV